MDDRGNIYDLNDGAEQKKAFDKKLIKLSEEEADILKKYPKEERVEQLKEKRNEELVFERQNFPPSIRKELYEARLEQIAARKLKERRKKEKKKRKMHR